MFVRIKTTPNSPRCSVQIVESVRDGDRVRQKIIRYVGIAMNDTELEKLKFLAEEIRIGLEAQGKSGDLFGDAEGLVHRERGRPRVRDLGEALLPSQVSLDDVEEERRVVDGVGEVAGALYEELGFHRLLQRGAGVALKQMVLMRLMEPLSKLSSCERLTAFGDQALTVDRVYRMLDQLEGVIPKLQDRVRSASLRLYDGVIDLALFDVTTLYFESTQTDGLREYGYSKDQKYHSTQVVLALATTADGLPLGYELFPGNTAETHTLMALLQSWKEKGLSPGRLCWVADRALFSEVNLKALEQAGWTYVVAVPLRRQSQDLQQQVLSSKNYRLGQVQEEMVWTQELPWNQRRLIVSYSAKRHRKDQTDRDQIIQKLQNKQAKNPSTRKLISNQGYLKFTQLEGKQHWQINTDKVAKDAAWDGIHGILTNDPKSSALELLHRYRRLWVIEESFRITKHTLKARPIYHFKPSRVKAHIALCYLSFALLRHLVYRVKLTQRDISPQKILHTLTQVQASIYIHKRTKDRYRMPSAMSHEARIIYRALGIKRDLSASLYRKS